MKIKNIDSLIYRAIALQGLDSERLRREISNSIHTLKSDVIDFLNASNKCDIVKQVASIEFRPLFETTSADPREDDRYATVARNGLQQIINILSAVKIDKEKNYNDIRAWITIVIAIISVIIAYVK